MDVLEFSMAMQSLSCALLYKRPRGKPKSIMHAAKYYGRGVGAKPKHMKELCGKTLNELFDMLYELPEK